MSFSDDWQHCYVSGCSQDGCTDGAKELKYESLVSGLAYFQYCSVLIAILLYGVTIAHIILVDKLNKILHVIEVNICLALMLNHLSIVFGYLLSPCQLLANALPNYRQESFKTTFFQMCQVMSAVQLGTNIAAFSWILLQAFCFQIQAAKDFVSKRNQSVRDRARSHVKDQRTPKLSTSYDTHFNRFMDQTSARRKHHSRTFSKDLTASRSEISYSSSVATAAAAATLAVPDESSSVITSDEVGTNHHAIQSWWTRWTDSPDDVWYIKWLARADVQMLSTVCPVLMWLPAAAVSAAAYMTAPNVSQRDKNSLVNISSDDPRIVKDIAFWDSHDGIDIYCTPSKKSQMVLYNIVIVVVLSLFTWYMSVRTMQTIRMIKWMEMTGLPSQVTISTVLKAWQNYKVNYNRHHKKYPLTSRLKASSLKLFLMCVSWTLVTFQQMFIWGMSVPFGFAVLMQGFVFLSLNVGQRYNHVWDCLAEGVERAFPFLKAKDEERDRTLSSDSEGTDDS